MIVTEEVPLQKPEDKFFKSYVELGLSKAQEGYNTLEIYSPAMAALVGSALTTVQEWTPEALQEFTVEGVDYLDEVLEAALERAKELKGNLTREDVIFLVEQLRNEATQAHSQIGDKISAYLPSSTLKECELKEKVNEIVSKVLSQPQIIKEKASGLAKDLHSNLDFDNDGKVSVKDICVNAMGVTSSATEYVCTTLDSVSSTVLSNLPENVIPTPTSFEEFVMPLATPYLDSIKNQWKKGEALKDAFLPLWSAIEVLKTYVSLYASNIQSKFEPLSPYLMTLLGSTSVLDVPLEIIQVLQAAGGFVADKERDAVVKETRALFWALIDISFLLEVLQEEKNEEKPVHNMEGVEFLKDADAVQDVSQWAGAFTDLKFA